MRSEFRDLGSKCSKVSGLYGCVVFERLRECWAFRLVRVGVDGIW